MFQSTMEHVLEYVPIYFVFFHLLSIFVWAWCIVNSDWPRTKGRVTEQNADLILVKANGGLNHNGKPRSGGHGSAPNMETLDLLHG